MPGTAVDGDPHAQRLAVTLALCVAFAIPVTFGQPIREQFQGGQHRGAGCDQRQCRP